MMPYCVWGDCVNTVLVEEIRSWPAANTGCDFPALVSYLTRRLNTPLTDPDVQTAVNWLTARGLAKLDAGYLKLTEPDRPELSLYEPLLARFRSKTFLRHLGVEQASYVLQDTSTGGTAAPGLLTRPDFTIATIRASLFERGLDVITIEVKNRAGSSVKAVYETLGHGRVAHYPYLACPRSHLDNAKMCEIREACHAQNVGLILFDIEEDGIGGFDIRAIKIDRKPSRWSPARSETENYLINRLTQENRRALEGLGRS